MQLTKKSTPSAPPAIAAVPLPKLRRPADVGDYTYENLLAIGKGNPAQLVNEWKAQRGILRNANYVLQVTLNSVKNEKAKLRNLELALGALCIDTSDIPADEPAKF